MFWVLAKDDFKHNVCGQGSFPLIRHVSDILRTSIRTTTTTTTTTTTPSPTTTSTSISTSTSTNTATGQVAKGDGSSTATSAPSVGGQSTIGRSSHCRVHATGFPLYVSHCRLIHTAGFTLQDSHYKTDAVGFTSKNLHCRIFTIRLML